jgi:predicted nucleic-acid-binding protein
VIGLDANVLLGLLEPEDSARGQGAKILLKQARSDGEGYIHPLALAKLADALEQLVRQRSRVADYLGYILNAPEFTVGGEKAAREALKRYREGPGCFSDCLLAALNRVAGCESTFVWADRADDSAGFTQLAG